MDLTNSFLEIDPGMVLEIAVGIEPSEDIAKRYGFEDDVWDALQTFDPFLKAVSTKRTELQQSGYTFKMKAAMAAEDLLSDVYRRALSHDTHIKDKLEALKYTAKLAELEPVAQAKQAVQTGAGFSISIQLSNRSVEISAQPEPIDVTPARISNSDLYYE